LKKKKNLRWRTVRGSRIAFDSRGRLVIAPKWFKDWFKRRKRKK